MNTLKFSTLALSLVPGLGPIRSRYLLEYGNDASSIFDLSRKELNRLKWLPRSSAEYIYNKTTWEKADRIIHDCNASGFDVVCINETSYPHRLKQLPDAPVVIYRKGQMSPSRKKVLGIVGTRNPSKSGMDICTQIIRDSSHLDLIIVSGLAYGIDILAHKTAIELGMATECVLGGAIDRIYPKAHEGVLSRMYENGGAWSEFPPGTEAERAHFPMRNRIIAGLSDMILVVESKRKGGSMITANLANQYDREVGAIPGSPIAKRSNGCNHLIKTQAAHLIDGAKDIMALMQWNDEVVSDNQQSKDLSPEQEEIVRLLNRTGPLHLDILKSELGKTDGQWAKISLEMEMSGDITILPGNIIQSN